VERFLPEREIADSRSQDFTKESNNEETDKPVSLCCDATPIRESHSARIPSQRYELQACLKAASERVELRTYDEFHPTPTSQLAYQSLLCTDTTRSALWLILNSVYIDRM
jgi:hypothetical protein